MNMSTLCTIKYMNRSFKVIILLLFIKTNPETLQYIGYAFFVMRNRY